MKHCEQCQHELTKKHQKRFCSLSCAAKFNNAKRPPMSEEQKIKLSVSLKRAHEMNKSNFSRGTRHSKAVGKSTRGKFRKDEPNSILELSTRTQQKIIRRMNIPCVVCGWCESTTDIHHIIPRKNGGSDDHSNLTIVCPNHHRMLHTKKLDASNLKTISQILGDSWKDFYYG